MDKRSEYNTGITLIALIITVILMLMFAAITINVSTDGALFDHTGYSVFASKIKELEENVDLKQTAAGTEYTGTLNDLFKTENEYNDKIVVQEGKLAYNLSAVSNKEKRWLDRMGIPASVPYYTVEYDFADGSENEQQLIREGNNTTIPDINNMYFQDWYYIETTGTEDNPTYTEKVFNKGNDPISDDYYVYAKYLDSPMMIARDTSKSIWKSTYRQYITSIVFTDEPERVPSEYVDATDISTSSSTIPIMAYIVDTSENDVTSYDAIIYCPETIYANSNSNGYFQEFLKLTSIDFSNFDTSKVIIMSRMFGWCYKLPSLDLSSFDTSRVTTMFNMFIRCEKLKTVDVSSFKTNKVRDFQQMFRECYVLTSLDLSHFNTDRARVMKNMFMSCNALETLDISHFNTSKVTSMRFMFSNCLVLKALNVSSFDTSKVTDMDSMFYRLKKITVLDIRNFDTRKVRNFDRIFAGCSLVNNIYVGENWIIPEGASASRMFEGCKVSKVTKL